MWFYCMFFVMLTHAISTVQMISYQTNQLFKAEVSNSSQAGSRPWGSSRARFVRLAATTAAGPAAPELWGRGQWGFGSSEVSGVVLKPCLPPAANSHVQQDPTPPNSVVGLILPSHAPNLPSELNGMAPQARFLMPLIKQEWIHS